MNRARLLAALVDDEGSRRRGDRHMPYRDSEGLLTIGYGRNIEERGISEEEAKLLLLNDVSEVERDLDRTLPWWREMNHARQEVLANMCFNLGLPRLLTFRKALAHMQAGRYAEAAEEMLDSRWATQVGKRAHRLAKQMRTGVAQ